MYEASKYGLTQNEWTNLISTPQVNKKVRNQVSDMKAKNIETAQVFSEAVVIIAFFFLTSYISITGSELGTEKGNHIIEEILAAIPAKKHFAGKMLGIFFLIGLQIFIYIVLGSLAYFSIKQLHYTKILNFIPHMKNLSMTYIIIVAILTIISLTLYILLAACFSSFVSRTEDISQATGSVASLMLIPYFLSFITQNNPNMGILKVLSFFPFMSHGIMPVRLAQGATSYTEGYIAIIISLIFTVIMYILTEKTYAQNIFLYNAKSPIKAAFSYLLKSK